MIRTRRTTKPSGCYVSSSSPEDFTLVQDRCKTHWVAFAPSLRMCYSRRRYEPSRERCSTHCAWKRAWRSRTRPRSQRSCRPEHDRDGRDRTFRRDPAGHQSHGRPAVFAGLGRRRSARVARRLCLVRTGRCDAACWGQLRFPSRSLRPRPHGSLDVLPVRLADLDSSSLEPGFRRHRLLSIRFLPLPAWKIWTESRLRRARNSARDPALSPHCLHRKNLSFSLGRCCRHDPLAHLGRRHALPAAPRFHLCAGILGSFLAVLGFSRFPHPRPLDGIFSRFFPRVPPKKKSPHFSLLFLGTLTFLFALLFKLRPVIAAFLAFRLIIQFIGQAVGVILLRRRWPPERLPFKMWFYPLPAVLTIAGWMLLFL